MSRAHDVCDYQAVVEILHTVESYSTAHSGIDADAAFFLDHLFVVVFVDGSEEHKLGFPLISVGIFGKLFDGFAFSKLIHDM